MSLVVAVKIGVRFIYPSVLIQRENNQSGDHAASPSKLNYISLSIQLHFTSLSASGLLSEQPFLHFEQVPHIRPHQLVVQTQLLPWKPVIQLPAGYSVHPLSSIPAICISKAWPESNANVTPCPDNQRKSNSPGVTKLLSSETAA
ncbi:hypothetical protein J3459_015408 [Metarhizium acridum]|nr:hypothetical protein J3459_015408 [Metarhizium acridum]